MSQRPIGPNRRQLLVAGVAAAGASPTVGLADMSPDPVETDLKRYAGFGIKASGGSGDMACGVWLESELIANGFTTERQTISVPYFNPRRSELETAGTTAPVIPQAIVVPTTDAGISGRLVRIDPAFPPDRSLAESIALVELPFERWSSALEKPVRAAFTVAKTQGARAVVIVTTGPTQQAIALNADGNKPPIDVPVVLLAPKHAAPFLAAAAKEQPATLFVTGDGGRRNAFNLSGRLDRGKRRWIVVSTPRSGWFTCAAERGPGVAVWLALARWAPAALENFNLAFLCNTAHEYEYLGAQQALQKMAPTPEVTSLWLALGASLAARDWHELGSSLLPLPSADPQRFLVVSDSLLTDTRQAFAGQPGFEAPYKIGDFAAGELATVRDAGYGTVAGVFGAHRYHHTQMDDQRCLIVEPTRQAIAGFCRVLQAAAAQT